jgi:hypothetical protein
VTGQPLPLPPLPAVLLRRRAEALSALAGAGWRPWARPLDLDSGRRRLLNIDLGEPDVFLPAPGGGVLAVARLEADRAGEVVLWEITAAVPVEARALAAALFPPAAEPRPGGGPEAREWVWGPEAGNGPEVGGEPVRLWVCAERAYGDRLWAVASVVRHGVPAEDE